MFLPNINIADAKKLSTPGDKAKNFFKVNFSALFFKNEKNIVKITELNFRGGFLKNKIL